MLAVLAEAAHSNIFMKIIITILSLLFAVEVLAQPPYFIDFSTLSTNTHVSVWTMVVTNSPRNTNGIVLSNTNYVDVGESSASAWGKANSNFTYFAQSMGGSGSGIATNGGIGWNTTLNSPAFVSGFNFTQVIISHTNVLVVKNAVVTNAPYERLNGEWYWNPNFVSPFFGITGCFTNVYPGRGTQSIYYNALGNIYEMDAGLPVTGPILYTNTFLTGIYTSGGAQFPPGFSCSISFLMSTNSIMLVNNIGPSGGEILFPGGDAIYEQSMSDINVNTDSGLSFGLKNGQIFGEKYSIVLGSYNDVAGFATASIQGATISGGTNNIIGDSSPLGVGFGSGSWSIISGGVSNTVEANYGIAIGSYATVVNNNSTIITDSATNQTTANNNQLDLYFQNGVNVNTNVGTSALNVGGDVDSLSYSVGGVVGLTATLTIWTNSAFTHGYKAAFTGGILTSTNEF